MRFAHAFRRSPYRDLERRIGYRFRRPALLEDALTHPSYRAEHPECAGDNQRLEFLGDAALTLVIGHHLFDENPDLSEGPLTQLRSSVTSSRALVAIAREIAVGPHLRLGRGEAMSGGADRDSNLEDVVEAVVGAAFLDGGLKAVGRIVQTLFIPRIAKPSGSRRAEYNPKGELQEICQARWKRSPRYRVASTEGPGHAKRFAIEAVMDERVLGRGRGASKKAAEAAAAEAAVAALRRAPGQRN